MMKNAKSLYYGHRFPAAVISCAVRWYFRFQLSLRLPAYSFPLKTFTTVEPRNGSTMVPKERASIRRR
jgi:hypothetical protein